jgi:hypothetical protein
MDLHARRERLLVDLATQQDAHTRALAAADRATLQMAATQGQIALIDELLKERTDGQS